MFAKEFSNVLSYACVVAGVALSATTAMAGEKVLGALGDSISVGFNATRIGNNFQYSWATGDEEVVNSHKLRLKAYSGDEVTAHNVAVAGSVAGDLDAQIDKLAVHKPDYTTVTIGANDICSWPDDFAAAALQFDAKVRNAVQRLQTINGSMTILLSPIPDMYNLWDLSVRRVGCQAKWDLLRMCPDLLGRDRTEAERQAFMQRWETANDIIHQIALDNPTNVIHNPDLAHVEFTWDHISTIDCYHPSAEGQALYAEKTWELLLASRP
jgi:hypothetical protein